MRGVTAYSILGVLSLILAAVFKKKEESNEFLMVSMEEEEEEVRRDQKASINEVKKMEGEENNSKYETAIEIIS